MYVPLAILSAKSLFLDVVRDFEGPPPTEERLLYKFVLPHEGHGVVGMATRKDFPWKIGRWERTRGHVVNCHNGFHASRDPSSAFAYVPTGILCEVEVRGRSDVGSDKEAWSEMRVVRAWKLPFEKFLKNVLGSLLATQADYLGKTEVVVGHVPECLSDAKALLSSADALVASQSLQGPARSSADVRPGEACLCCFNWLSAVRREAAMALTNKDQYLSSSPWAHLKSLAGLSRYPLDVWGFTGTAYFRREPAFTSLNEAFSVHMREHAPDWSA